jgi:ribonuclease HII
MKKPNYKTELEKLAEGYKYVVGCDEVGRGCLAGPVVAATVVLNPELVQNRKHNWYKQIRDSKLLPPAKRQNLAELIKRESLAWGIGAVQPKVIDEINIHHASLQAMNEAVKDFRKILQLFDPHGTDDDSFVLVDGRFKVTNCCYEQQAIIDGDASVLSIAAASILAKVHRDELMVKLHEQFPKYEFHRHKGYATKLHWEAIKKYGLSPVHRLSFCQ